MMNMMIGFAGLYTEGLPPSSIPPCGGALAVLSEVAEVTVVVTNSVTVLVRLAILLFFASSLQLSGCLRISSPPTH